MLTEISSLEQERQRVAMRYEELLAEKQRIDSELEAVEREQNAFDAFDAVLAGKSPFVKKEVKAKKTKRPRQKREHIEGLREQVYLKVCEFPDGIKKVDLLIAFNARGNATQTTAVSNALRHLVEVDRIYQPKTGYYAPKTETLKVDQEAVEAEPVAQDDLPVESISSPETPS